MSRYLHFSPSVPISIQVSHTVHSFVFGSNNVSWTRILGTKLPRKVLPPARNDSLMVNKPLNGGFQTNGGTPIAGWFIKNNPIEMDDY